MLKEGVARNARVTREQAGAPGDWDGRWLTAAIIAFYYTLLCGLADVFGQPPYLIWRKLGVPAWDIPFLDLIYLPASVESMHAGYNPRVENPFDPLHRPFNYPHWWLYGENVGLTRHTYVFFGMAIGLLVFVGALFVLGRLSKMEGVVAGLFLVAPNFIFDVERGNIDCILFLLMAGVLAARRWPLIASLLLIIGGVLKFYPAAGFLALLAPPWRRNITYMAVGTVVLASIFWNMRAELSNIAALAPYQWERAMGSATPGLYLCALYHWKISSGIIFWSGTVLLVVVLLLAIRFRPAIDLLPGCERELFAFRLGTGLYVGAFALGCNLDYRIIVLTFCFPLLFQLRRIKGIVNRWATTALVLILAYAYWAFVITPGSELTPAKQVVTWGIVFCLTGLWWAMREWQPEKIGIIKG